MIYKKYACHEKFKLVKYTCKYIDKANNQLIDTCAHDLAVTFYYITLDTAGKVLFSITCLCKLISLFLTMFVTMTVC